MSCQRRAIVRRRAGTSAVLLSLCLALSACGGDGASSVASIPPPPVAPTPAPGPTPTSAPAVGAYPLTRSGSYDLLGRLWDFSRATVPGEFTMAVSATSGDEGFDYKLHAPAGVLPGGLTSIDFGPSGAWSTNANGYLRGSYSRTLPFSPDQNLATSLYLDAGYSYVSMGEWDWYFVHLDGGTAGGFGALQFVNGDRTPFAGIPVSGKANYDAHTLSLLSSNLAAGIPFTLTADFDARTISTQIDQNYRYNPNGDSMDYPAPGIHVSGSAPFSNSGTFDIPLAGTANYNSGYAMNTPQTPPSQSATGNMNGAFFGPHAEQVGGTFAVGPAGGEVLLQDAFVGQQQTH